MAKSQGARIVLKLDVTVDELLALQKNWKASGVRSLEEHVMKLLFAEPKEALEAPSAS